MELPGLKKKKKKKNYCQGFFNCVLPCITVCTINVTKPTPYYLMYMHLTYYGVKKGETKKGEPKSRNNEAG